MIDPLLDDVKALLDKDFGDDRILKQICRACERHEIISNYEKNYVRELAEKHLGRKPEFVPPPEESSIPVIQMPTVQQTQHLQTKVPRLSRKRLTKKKIMIGIVGLLLLVIIAAVASSSGSSTDSPVPAPGDVTDIPAGPVLSLTIQTDFESYNKKDLISISGGSTSTGIVDVTIENENNELVWREEIPLKSDGRFSTLAIAGGTGWENSGTYTIIVDDGIDLISNTFSFTS